MAMKTLPLAGKTAMVTGAARRLGRATALALAADGADVVVHYNRSADEAERTASGVRELGRDAWTLQCDLSDLNAVDAMVPWAIENAGPPDVLVNNASMFTPDHIVDVPPERIEANVRVHAEAPLLLSRAMAAQGRPGHVVNLLDSRVVDYDREHAAYHLSKRMLLTLTRMLAMELAPLVSVNAVAPGLILPPPGEDESYLTRLAHTNPLNRVGSAAGITRAIRFLLASEFITGQVIYVDGGRHMKGRMYE